MQQTTAKALMRYTIYIFVISVASGNNRVVLSINGLAAVKPDLLPVLPILCRSWRGNNEATRKLPHLLRFSFHVRILTKESCLALGLPRHVI